MDFYLNGQANNMYSSNKLVIKIEISIFLSTPLLTISLSRTNYP